MLTTSFPSPPTGLVPRFGQFIGAVTWEPVPCYPFGEKPPRRRRSRAVDPWAPEPAPPPPARPRPAREPPPRPNPERRLSDYNWIGRLFMR